MKYKPWAYQSHAEDWILTHRNCGLFLEMGLGKTVITLSAVKKLIDERVVTRVLVVAPLRVAATVWAEEARKWDHLGGLRIVKVLGSRGQRISALERNADIYVINRENVDWLVNHFAEKHRWPFDMVVLDELSSFKSSKSQRFRALRRVRPFTRRVVGLTGTPTPNGLIDLWSQIYLLDGGERLGKTLGGFRERWFNEGQRNAQVVFNWIPKPGADKEIYSLISDICMSMKAEDYLELPERNDVIYPVRLEKGVLGVYNTMARDLVLSMADEEITASNAAVLTGKLLQLANGAIYTESHDFIQIHDGKLDALEDLIEAANGQPLLVYYMFQHDYYRICKRFPWARRLSTPKDVNDWNAGKIPLLLAHPDSAGHGLNLQDGGHIIVWYGLTWSLEKYQQANARLHRQGQKRPVTVYHIVAEETIDRNVLTVLQGKEARQEALIDAVKAVIEKYAR